VYTVSVPVLASGFPSEISLRYTPRDFNEVVLQQSQHLNLNFGRGLCTEVEEEFRYFKLASREIFYAQKLGKQSDILEFKEGWEPFGQRYPKLRHFCAGIATVFAVLALPPSFPGPRR
jgi:hypothetical protein